MSTDHNPDLVDKLAAEYCRIILDQAAHWEQQFPAGPGLVVSVSDAARVIARHTTRRAADVNVAGLIQDTYDRWVRGREEETWFTFLARALAESGLLTTPAPDPKPDPTVGQLSDAVQAHLAAEWHRDQCGCVGGLRECASGLWLARPTSWSTMASLGATRDLGYVLLTRHQHEAGLADATKWAREQADEIQGYRDKLRDQNFELIRRARRFYRVYAAARAWRARISDTGPDRPEVWADAEDLALIAAVDALAAPAPPAEEPAPAGGPVEYVNLTPHEITVRDPDGTTTSYPSTGTPARIAETATDEPSGDSHRRVVVRLGDLNGLPPHRPGVVYIVSMPCAMALAAARSTRPDVVYPYELYRDAAGRTQGALALARIEVAS